MHMVSDQTIQLHASPVLQECWIHALNQSGCHLTKGDVKMKNSNDEDHAFLQAVADLLEDNLLMDTDAVDMTPAQMLCLAELLCNQLAGLPIDCTFAKKRKWITSKSTSEWPRNVPLQMTPLSHQDKNVVPQQLN